ncbi:DNA replication and repair protein RecO [Ekhidna lutea]|uniref:DNA repair protein RecO n=1 Tax=Ekhidna lutea TaxID=447679 RepID=A0A239F0I4_EKHLU|nr:DNA repair protein RecO [Ekhidna lutea]SNS50436.1 DNA replication and repair protein RecO [Ekhidna lutea]
MIVKSNGIVLSYMKYGDSSIIARIFTEENGYGSYIVNSIRSAKSKKSIGYFQPFSILELILYVKETRDLQRISEFKNHYPLHTIHSDLTKSAITMFLSEVFSKLLQSEQSPNPQLFDFAKESIKALDLLEHGVANFHLQFLLKLGPFLGYAVDEIDNLFSSTERLAPSVETHHVMDRLMNEKYGAEIPLNHESRNEKLNVILDYYQHHAHIPKPKSLEVLRSILH